MYLMLRPLVLYRNNHSRWHMRNANRRVRRIYMLPSSPRTPIRIYPQILLGDLYIYLLCLREYRNGHRAGVDSPAGLGERDTLDTVNAGLVFEAAEGPVAGDVCGGSLE